MREAFFIDGRGPEFPFGPTKGGCAGTDTLLIDTNLIGPLLNVTGPDALIFKQRKT